MVNPDRKKSSQPEKHSWELVLGEERKTVGAKIDDVKNTER